MKKFLINANFSIGEAPRQAIPSNGDFFPTCSITGDNASLFCDAWNWILSLKTPDDSIDTEEYEIELSIYNSPRRWNWVLSIQNLNSQFLKKITIKWVHNANFLISSLVICGNSIPTVIKNGAIQDANISVVTDLFIKNCIISGWNIYSSELEKLYFLDSDLWKCYLNNITIDDLVIKNCNINNIQLSNINIKNVDTSWMRNPEIKELYRHLKYLFDEIWNKTEANKFFAEEMEYYQKSLSLKDLDKIMISFLQRYSNNYGNSWLRPLVWIILLSFLYTLIANCPSFACVCWNVQDWSCFSSHWLKNVSQFPTELKNASNWWFFWYSIVMGSLIYQFLVALRRISQR